MMLVAKNIIIFEKNILMSKSQISYNTPRFFFSAFFLLFAISPFFEENDMYYYINFSLSMICFEIAVISVILYLTKNKEDFFKNLTSKSPFIYIDVIISILALIISFWLHASYKVWIFFLILNTFNLMVSVAGSKRSKKH
ncbi:hypothetical protein [Prevotella bivia]|uniref:Uncharacterized protein n=1 Tax=Prevotella bivia DSM 20514 TaxID=868129 RepID=I4Z859_9BACT|nr:hypothetical protein [Prevotella bivia]EIM32401.1 hypothetical protein PrebiDRAFT_0661 [Prevotella bivia DSM 20514]MDU2328497.1 hypothetical protein [Prevotella bivia]MDU5343809.1 hypothetical protein [Prevotella bivia]WIL17336.1 hypothetical protein QP022_03395 [Prevotella bivia]